MLQNHSRRDSDHSAREDTRRSKKSAPDRFCAVASRPSQYTLFDAEMQNLSRHWSDMLESSELAQKHVFRAKRFGRVTNLVKREWSGNHQRKSVACPYVVSSLIQVFRPPKVLCACTDVARARRRALFPPFQPHGKSAPDIVILQPISMVLMPKQRYIA
jgi:hypothetical protein